MGDSRSERADAARRGRADAAQRLVAQRCLYGVDKNIFAVDLAKLSLWLATLAQDHPFTFLDHALRHGDSLVGLSREQIACFHWETETAAAARPRLIDKRVAEAQRLREMIQGPATSDDVPEKTQLLRDAEGGSRTSRFIGDLVVVGVLRARQAERSQDAADRLCGTSPRMAERRSNAGPVTAASLWLRLHDALRRDEHPSPPFHWEIEFPEVFTRENSGFDAIVGNPPFVAGSKISQPLSGCAISTGSRRSTRKSHGNADLVAHFFRRAFNLLRHGWHVRPDRDQHHRAGRYALDRPALDSARRRDDLRGPQASEMAGAAAAVVVVSVVHVVTRAHSVGRSDLDG